MVKFIAIMLVPLISVLALGACGDSTPATISSREPDSQPAQKLSFTQTSSPLPAVKALPTPTPLLAVQIDRWAVVKFS